MREAKPKSLQGAMTLIISLPLKGLLRITSVKKYLENLLFVWLCNEGLVCGFSPTSVMNT